MSVEIKKSPVKTNLLDLDRQAMEVFFSQMGEKAFRTSQVLKWIYSIGVHDFDEMTNLSKVLRTDLKANAEIKAPEMVRQQTSKDGTCKWLFQLDDGNCIETVLIPEKERGTLCVSSQVGCALDCSFCCTAQQGFNRNLSVSEIIGQVWWVYHHLNSKCGKPRPITNVVLMGMGEPLLNFNNVISAINLMMDDLCFGLSKRRITLSTAGVVPALDRFTEISDVSLAISLHATTNEIRNTLVPLNKKYPLESLIAACKRYVEKQPGRSITFEYVMIDGINDLPLHARELVKMLKGIPSKINLIPFNPFSGTSYVCSTAEAIERFRQILMAAGLISVTRKPRGEDIDAACGQLAGQVKDRSKRNMMTRMN